MIEQTYGKSEASYECEDGRVLSFTLLTVYDINEITVSIRPKSTEAACTEERSICIDLDTLGKKPMESLSMLIEAAQGFANLADTNLTDEALDEVSRDCAALVPLVRLE